MPIKKFEKEEKEKIKKKAKEKAKEEGKEEKPSKKEIEKKAKQLVEKAKELEKKIEVKEIDIKKEVEKTIRTTKARRKEDTLIPLEDYVKSGIHLGTKVITPNMRQYVYKRRADGLAVLNTNIIDKKFREAFKFLSEFKPEDIIIACKREAGWHAVNLFSELTGIRAFTKRYPAGIITNLKLPDFFEPELVIICDPWLDKNALNDANKTNKKVLALCDTNNFVKGMDVIIPCNNKSNKSLGLVLHLLAKHYLKAQGLKKKVPGIEEFGGEKV